jgi:hypothetical protein
MRAFSSGIDEDALQEYWKGFGTGGAPRGHLEPYRLRGLREARPL